MCGGFVGRLGGVGLLELPWSMKKIMISFEVHGFHGIGTNSLLWIHLRVQIVGFKEGV